VKPPNVMGALDVPAPERIQLGTSPPPRSHASTHLPAHAHACSGLGRSRPHGERRRRQPAAALEGAALLVGGSGRRRPKSSGKAQESLIRCSSES
jgi:hypothetical protein